MLYHEASYFYYTGNILRFDDDLGHLRQFLAGRSEEHLLQLTAVDLRYHQSKHAKQAFKLLALCYPLRKLMIRVDPFLKGKFSLDSPGVSTLLDIRQIEHLPHQVDSRPPRAIMWFEMPLDRSAPTRR